MKHDELKDLDSQHIMSTYKRLDVVIDRGEGCYVYDLDGKKYLDFVGGIATCTVGHANPEVAKAISDQALKLTSVSNLYFTVPQILLAQKLSQLSGFQKSFFCHSGADANEAAIKLAKKVTGKKEFIAFKNSFHGRTTGSLALTWKPQFKESFLPLSPVVHFADYGDARGMEALITDDTAAVVVEPMQGEAGIVVPDKDFLKQVREVCTEHKILMIVDEVQTGVGRTGKFFDYQNAGIKPDIVTVAKGLANGLPIGVCLSDFELERGDHGSTLGGNNISVAAALATIEYIDTHDLMKNAKTVGEYLHTQLKDLQKTTALIKSVRGKGLMVGVVLSDDRAGEIVEQSMQMGLLCNATSPDVLRFLPPLIVTKHQVDDCINILRKVMS